MNNFEKHPHWKDVLSICTQLKQKGFVAWLAGGCVRDHLMGVSPQDFDVVTNAVPDEVQKLFPNSIDVGKSFGIIMVPFKDFRVEIATFRSDGTYADGRRPESVVFSTPEEDAERRDFTVNALFFDPFTQEIKDFVEGQKDLKAKILKAVGNPLKRFQEDKLRMLRAIRFCSQLDFKIEDSTWKALSQMAPEISVISKERIYYELKRLMETPRAGQGLKLLNESGLLEQILNPLKPHIQQIQKDFEFIEKSEKSFTVDEKFFLLWHTVLKSEEDVTKFKKYLKDLKFSQNQIDLYFYVTDAMQKIVENKISKAEKYKLVFHEHGKLSLKLGRVVLRENSPSLQKILEIEKLLNDFSKLPEPLINGEDLKQLGVKPSSQMKDILTKAYDYQLENKITDRLELISWTKDLIC